MENPIKKLFAYLKQEPSHALTFGYLLLIVIGIVFDFSYYNKFKINVLLFVELDDFLLAPIQDVGVLICVFVFCAFIFYLIELNIWWQTNYPEVYLKFTLFVKDPFSEKQNKKRQNQFIFLFISYIILGALMYGAWEAKKVKKGETAKILLEMNDSTSDTTKIKPQFFIGKTKSYYFLYDTLTKKATIVNAGEVKTVRFEE
jgi:hypothetical protein